MDIIESQNNQIPDVHKNIATQSLECLNEFAKSAWSSCVTEKINGARQLCGAQIAHHEAQPELHGAMQLSHIAGQTVGELCFFAGAAKLIGGGISKMSARGVAMEGSLMSKGFVGKPLVGAAKLLSSSALTHELVTAGSTGLLAGGVFRPVGDNESQWHRLGNAATEAATFMTLGGVAGKYRGAFAESMAGRLQLNALSGAAAGVVKTNMDAVTHGRVASVQDSLLGGAGFAIGNVVTGEALHGLGKVWQSAGKLAGREIEGATSEHDARALLERAQGITEKIDRTVPLVERPGLTAEEFALRMERNATDGMAVRTQPVGTLDFGDPATLPAQVRLEMTNRPDGALGNIDGYINHAGYLRVRHTDGTTGIYKTTEVAPAVVASDTPKDTSLVFKLSDQPITGLKMGDQLERGDSYPLGVASDWQEWHGMVGAEKVGEPGTKIGIPGWHMNQRTGLTLVDSNGVPTGKDPLDTSVGDLIDVTHPLALGNGLYKVVEVTGLHHSNKTELLDHEYMVTSVNANGNAVLKSTRANLDRNDRTFEVSPDHLREPFLRKIEPFSVKPGDELVAPIGARMPNSYDWNFAANVQGRRWTVAGQQDNGVILSNPETNSHFLVPDSYLNTRTMLPVQLWNARNQLTDHQGQ